MGHVRVPIKLANPNRMDVALEVPDALVDTGATWTAIPRRLADGLELQLVGNIRLRTAGGPREFEQSFVYLELQGKSMVAPVVIADLCDGVLIGRGGYFNNVLRLTPPLVVNADDVRRALAALDRAFTGVEKTMAVA